MFLKRFTFLAFFCTVFTAVSAKQLDATFDLVRFKANNAKNMVELYCSVNGNSVVYKAVPGGFQASVALEVLVSDSVGIRAAEKLVLKSPVVKDTAVFQAPFNLQKRLVLPNGNFKFTGKMQDMNAAVPATSIEVPVNLNYSKDKIQFSDVQLLESYAPTKENNDYVKSGFKLVSYVSNFFPKGMDRLKFYTEFYNAESVLGKDKPLVVFYRIMPSRDNLAKVTIAGQKVMKAAPVNVLLTELDIATLGSGNYEVVLEVRNEENKLMAVQSRYFQRSNPLTAAEQLAEATKANELPAAFTTDLDTTNLTTYVRALRPIANTNEQEMLETVARANAFQKQNYLFNFFKKRSETDPVRAWLEYKHRVEYVEKMFGNPAFPGHTTDLGRVYLKYGPPNQITTERTDVNRGTQNSDSRPYQIWKYYHLEKQGDRIFVFVQQHLGNNNYALAHSTAKGEVTNNEWRRMVRNGGTGANIEQRNRSFDRDGNETTDQNVIEPRDK